MNNNLIKPWVQWKSTSYTNRKMNFEKKQHILREYFTNNKSFLWGTSYRKHDFGCVYKSAICKWAKCLCTHAKRFLSHKNQIETKHKTQLQMQLTFTLGFFSTSVFKSCATTLSATKGNHIWWAKAVCCPLTYQTTHTHTPQRQFTNKVAYFEMCKFF